MELINPKNSLSCDPFETLGIKWTPLSRQEMLKKEIAALQEKGMLSLDLWNGILLMRMLG
jgi:hypothetical protein